jgi:cytochrome c oxidase assembly protein subunit 11
MSGAQRTARILTFVAVAMLGLGFASKPLYDTFCKVTGYGGTTKQAESNLSEIIDREINVYFDSNVQVGLPWDFQPEQVKLTVNVGQSGLAYYKVKNTASRAIVGTATYNVTPTKAAPFFIKTECFCFTEQRIEPGEELSFPVLFHVDSQIDDDKRLKDVRDITLSYTFFEIDDESATKTTAQLALDNKSLN